MMKSINRQVEDLGNEIASDIDHGECFYDEEMFKEFIASLDKLKRLARKYYRHNQAELEEY